MMEFFKTSLLALCVFVVVTTAYPNDPELNYQLGIPQNKGCPLDVFACGAPGLPVCDAAHFSRVADALHQLADYLKDSYPTSRSNRGIFGNDVFGKIRDWFNWG